MLINLVKGVTSAYYYNAELPEPTELFKICKSVGLEQFVDYPDETDGIRLVKASTGFEVYMSDRGLHSEKVKCASLDEAVIAKIILIYRTYGKG
jgi:hypothetical protein